MNQNYNFVQGLFSQVLNARNEELATKKGTSFKSLLLLVVFAFFASISMQGQTVLLSPTGDGGFENGATFAANNWAAVNSTTDSWFLGTVPVVSSGAKCAYITSTPTTTATWTYSQVSVIQHLYYDVTIPVGQPIVTMTFKWKALGEGTTTLDWDNLKIFWGRTADVGLPVANTAVGAAYQVSGSGSISGMYKLSSTAYNSETISFSGIPGTTYRLVLSWKSDGGDIANPPAAVDDISLVSSPISTFTASASGGLWSSPATWVGGVVPGSGNDVAIPVGSIVTVDRIISYRNLDINGTLQWNNTTPSSSVNFLTLSGNLTINSGGKFLAYSSVLTGANLNIAGNFQNDGYANLALPSTLINFNGSGSTLSGTGIFQGDGTRGIIRTLAFQNLGSNSITTTQNLIVTSGFIHTGGYLNTNGKLRIDNTAQIYGQALNLQVAGAAVTNMGSLYTAAPVVFGAPATQWSSITGVLNTLYVSGINVYRCTTAANIGTAAPTHNTGITDNLLWIGTTGTLGNPFLGAQAHFSGTLYFYGNNVYSCIVAGTPSTTTPPIHTTGVVASGTATFLYMGTVAKVAVNYDSVTGTVRSLNLTQAGYGFSTVPAIAISKGLGDTTGTGAVATAVIFQQIAGPPSASTSKSGGAATITGGLTINSDQGASIASTDVQASSGVGNIFTTNGGLNYTVAPLVGFAGPPTLNLVTNAGSGYTAAPTIIFTGGTLVSGTALATTNFTVTMNQGKVVSVYLNTATTATYSVPPTLAFSTGNATLAFPVGCWPAATANIGSNGQLTSFTMTNAGYGYAAAPIVGVGTTTATVPGGTFTTAATAPTARIALYNLTLNFFGPAVAAVVSADDAAIPANRKMNNLSLSGNGNGLNLTNNLTLFGTAPLTLNASASLPGNILDLGGNNLLFTWNGYAGTSSTFGDTKTFIKNGSMTLIGKGGGTTGSTFNFPFSGTVSTFTGGNTSAPVIAGTDILTVKVTEVATPTNSVTGGTGIALGSRAFKIDTATTLGAATSSATLTLGTPPTVRLNYNANDALSSSQESTFVVEAATLSGAWNIRSAAVGTSGALAATGAATTFASIIPAPVVYASGNFYTWGTGAPTIAGVLPAALCVNSGFFTISGTSLTGVTAVKIGGTAVFSFTIVNDTTITGYAGNGTTGNVSVTKNGVTVTGIETITVNPAPAAPSVSVASVNVNLGGTVTVTASGGSGTFNWYNAVSGGVSLFTGPTFSAPVCSGNLFVAQNNGSCEGLRTVVTITTTPTTITTSAASFCGVGSPVTLTAAPTDATITYSWSSLTAPATTAPATGTTSVTSSLSQTSDFRVTATKGACTAEANVSIGVYALPSATVTSSAQGVCPGTSATIGSGLVAGNFAVTSVPYLEYLAPANAVIVATGGVVNVPLSGGTLDDGGWSGLPIGFNFNFFGTSFNTISAGTNGLLMFGTPPGYGIVNGQLGQYIFNSTGGVFPNAANPGNVIALMAADQNFGSTTTSSLIYWTQGYAPNRIFVIEYNKVNPYSSSGSTATNFTAQARLYETLGTVDIAIVGRTAINLATVGLQDATKTIGAVAPGRQAFTTTIITPETWRFAPPANYNTTWSANGVTMPSVTANPTATPPVVGYANPGTNVFSIPVAPSATTTYSISYTNQTTGCTNAAGSAQVVMAVLGNIAPTGVNTISSASPICSYGDTVNLSLDYTGIRDGLTFLWQSSPNGITWTDIPAITTITYSVVPTAATQYRCKITACNGTPAFSVPVSLNFANSVVSTTPKTRCGTGTATLGATGSAGTTINWYANVTGGTSLGAGTSFVTPSITANTTYYAEANTGGVNVSVGPADPIAQGGTVGTQTVGWDVNFTVLSSTTLQSVTIFPQTSGNSGTLTIRNGSGTGGTIISTTIYTTTVGGGATPQVIFINSPLTVGNYSIYTDVIPSGGISRNITNASYPYTSALANITANGFDQNYFMGLYNWSFSSSCSSQRVPVIATVTAPPAIALSGNPVAICSEQSSAAVTVVTGRTDYDTYVWTPSATVTGNATSGWVFNPLSTTTYSLAVSQSTGVTPCAATTGITVNINPTPSVLSLSPAPASVCVNTVLPLVTTGGTLINNGIIGTGTTVNTSTSYPSLYTNYYGGAKHQMLIRASELTALGFATGVVISKIAFNVESVGSTFSGVLSDFQIDMGLTPSTVLTSTSFEGSLVTVLPASSTSIPTTGLPANVIHTLSTPFVWNGIDNLVIQTSYSNANSGTSTDFVIMKNSDPGFVSTNWYRADSVTSSVILAATTPSGSSNARPNMVITATNPTTMSWLPTTNLFSDAAATTPYTGGNASTVYVKSSTGVATTTYTATATTALGCVRTATVPVTIYQTLAPTGAATQSLSSLLTVGSIVAIGTNIIWYSSSANAASGTNPLPSSTVLTNTTYYGTQTVNGCASTTSLAVTITTLASQDFDMTKFSYYPNPVIDLLNVSYNQEMTNVKVFNMIGQQLLNKEVKDTSTQINMSSYANGAYLIQVSTETATKTVRVVKK